MIVGPFIVALYVTVKMLFVPRAMLQRDSVSITVFRELYDYIKRSSAQFTRAAAEPACAHIQICSQSVVASCASLSMFVCLLGVLMSYARVCVESF